MDFGVDDILVLKASYEGATRRLTMRKSHDLTIAALERKLVELFRISSAMPTQSGERNGQVHDSAGGAKTPGTPTAAAAAAGSPLPSGAGSSVSNGPISSEPSNPSGTVPVGGGGGSMGITGDSVLELTYKDVEGDTIGLVDDRDLKDALFFQRLNPLRVTVVLRDKTGVEGKKEKGSVCEKEDEEAVKTPRPEEKTVQIYFKAVGVELRETCKATTGTLESTVKKVTDMVQSAVAGHSSLVLEVRFDTPSAQSSATTSNGPAPVAVNGPSVDRGFLVPPLSQLPVPQQQQASQPQAPTKGPPASGISAPGQGVKYDLPGGPPLGLSAGPGGPQKHAPRAAAVPGDADTITMGLPEPASLPGQPAHLLPGGPHLRGPPGALGVGKGPGNATATCAVCKMSPVLGPRYQSIMKADYELCYSCFSAHGLEGNFQKVPADPGSASFAKTRAGAGVSSGRSFTPGPAAGPPGASGRYAAETSPGLDSAALADGGKGLPVHEGIECDLCRMCPIVGPRYKSNMLQDFDLCRDCYRGEANKHGYDEILAPMDPSPRRP